MLSVQSALSPLGQSSAPKLQGMLHRPVLAASQRPSASPVSPQSASTVQLRLAAWLKPAQVVRSSKHTPELTPSMVLTVLAPEKGVCEHSPELTGKQE